MSLRRLAVVNLVLAIVNLLATLAFFAAMAPGLLIFPPLALAVLGVAVVWLVIGVGSVGLLLHRDWARLLLIGMLRVAAILSLLAFLLLTYSVLFRHGGSVGSSVSVVSIAVFYAGLAWWYWVAVRQLKAGNATR